METWFAEAKRISSLEARVCLLLQDDFYFGSDSFPSVSERKEVEPLPSPTLVRHAPPMVRTSEIIGHENELANYYRAVLRIARSHSNSFKEIGHYFWLRFWLWNTEQQTHISIPWYDSFSEIDRFLVDVSADSDGQDFWDRDQGGRTASLPQLPIRLPRVAEKLGSCEMTRKTMKPLLCGHEFVRLKNGILGHCFRNRDFAPANATGSCE